MNFLEMLFGSGKKKTFKMRFSKSEGNWQVYKEGSLVYLGEKTACETYIANMSV